MGATKKFAIGLGLAGGALLTAWLLSGSGTRKKTKDYLVKKADDLRKSLRKDKNSNETTDVHYI